MVQGEDKAHIAWDFVAQQVFAVLVVVEIKDAGDEVLVQHGIAGSEQSFKVSAICSLANLGWSSSRGINS